MQEYYPNALLEGYKGVKGYIYSINHIDNLEKQNITGVYTTNNEVPIDDVEVIEDAYEEILKAEKDGKISILRYNEFISNENKRKWLIQSIVEQYESSNNEAYKYFLKSKFDLEKFKAEYDAMNLNESEK